VKCTDRSVWDHSGPCIPGVLLISLFRDVLKDVGDQETTLRRLLLERPAECSLTSSGAAAQSPVVLMYRECMCVLRRSTNEPQGTVLINADDSALLHSCVVNARTLGDAISTTIRFVAALGNRAGRLMMRSEANHAVFTMEPSHPVRSAAGAIYDFLSLCFYYKLFSWLIVEPLCVVEMSSVHTPAVDREVMDHLVAHKIRFDAEENAIVFSRDLLDKPVLLDHTGLSKVCALMPLELVSLPPTTPLTDYVSRLVRRLLDDTHAIPTLERVALLVGKSCSTVRRRLASEGTSFQALIDECRLEKATALLNGSNMTIDDIACRVGFSAPSGFSRAFKDWTGAAPSEYRQRPSCGSNGSKVAACR
jgi:AraC-like DNA-binding protein